MSESSTEVKTEEKAPEVKVPPQQGDTPKVPVIALQKEREQKRAAQDQLAKANEELKKVKEANPQFDMEALLNTLAQASAQHAKEAVAEALRPVEEERSRLRMAVELGLNPTQAGEVFATMNKYPGIPEKEALLLVRASKPDLFSETRPAPTAARLFGGAPVGGDSPMRSAPEKEDFLAKMYAAQAEVKSGKVEKQAEATHWAREEFLRRARTVFENRPRT